MEPWAFGFVTSLGLIAAIGAQNAFVLRAGIARKQVLTVALTTGLCGAAFLLVYGSLALRNAFQRSATDWGDAAGFSSVGTAVVATLAITLLNPHVYLDTVVLLGGIGGRLEPPARWAFAMGAAAASLVWFFSLAFGAKALAPTFRWPRVARGLNLFVAAVLFTVAAKLVRTCEPPVFAPQTRSRPRTSSGWGRKFGCRHKSRARISSPASIPR